MDGWCLPLLYSLAPGSSEEDFFFWLRPNRVVPEKGRKTLVCCVCVTGQVGCLALMVGSHLPLSLHLSNEPGELW